MFVTYCKIIIISVLFGTVLVNPNTADAMINCSIRPLDPNCCPSPCPVIDLAKTGNYLAEGKQLIASFHCLSGLIELLNASGKSLGHGGPVIGWPSEGKFSPVESKMFSRISVFDALADGFLKTSQSVPVPNIVSTQIIAQRNSGDLRSDFQENGVSRRTLLMQMQKFHEAVTSWVTLAATGKGMKYPEKTFASDPVEEMHSAHIIEPLLEENDKEEVFLTPAILVVEDDVDLPAQGRVMAAFVTEEFVIDFGEIIQLSAKTKETSSAIAMMTQNISQLKAMSKAIGRDGYSSNDLFPSFFSPNKVAGLENVFSYAGGRLNKNYSAMDAYSIGAWAIQDMANGSDLVAKVTASVRDATDMRGDLHADTMAALALLSDLQKIKLLLATLLQVKTSDNEVRS